MAQSDFYVFSVRRLIVTIGLMLVVLVLGISTVMADLVQPDGRLNQVHHFGGDAFYCVDANKNPTMQYGSTGGGFRLLNIAGQELWFIPEAVVSAAAAQAEASGQGVLVAEGMGTYGPVTLWTFTNADGYILFSFTGYDEFGKANTMVFKYCEPNNPSPGTDTGIDQPAPGEPADPQCLVGFDIIDQPGGEIDVPFIPFEPIFGSCSLCEEPPYFDPFFEAMTCGELRPS